MASHDTLKPVKREIPLKPHYPDARTVLVERDGEPQHYIHRTKKIGKNTLGITYYEPLDPAQTSINAIHYVPGLLTPEGGVAAAAGATAILGYPALTHESRRKSVAADAVSDPSRPRTAITYQGEGVVEATGIISDTFGITKSDWAGHSMGGITLVEAVHTLEPGDPREPRSILGVAPAGYRQMTFMHNVLSHAMHIKGMYATELRPHFGKFIQEAPDDIKQQFLRHIGSAPLRAIMEGYATLSTNISPEDIQTIKSRGIRVGRLDAELDEFVPPKTGDSINAHLDWRGEVKNGLHFDLMAHPLRTADDIISAIETLNDQRPSAQVA